MINFFKGYVTPARNQKRCKTCVAFAFNALLESCLLKAGANKTNLDLSEQTLLDCDTTNGCTEGALFERYKSLFSGKMEGHFFHEEQYPYKGNQTGYCPIQDGNWYNPGASVEKMYTANNCDEEFLKQMVIFLIRVKQLIIRDMFCPNIEYFAHCQK